MIEDTKKATNTNQSNFVAQKNTVLGDNNIICQGQAITNEYLLNHAMSLTKATNALQVALDLMAKANCQRQQGTQFDTNYFVNAELPHLVDLLGDVIEDVQQVSDDICPD